MCSKIVFLLILISNTLFSFGQNFSTGLRFADPKELAGIPLASTPFSGDELPASADLSDRMPPPGQQGRQSSCVAWSVAYAVKSYQEKLEEGSPYLLNGSLNFGAVFSPAFIYNQINNGVDGGSHFIDALNVLSQQGAAKMDVMPYNESDYLLKPSGFQMEQARKYKIDFWRQVNIRDLKEVKAQINAGYPVMIGSMVDKEFYLEGSTGAKPFIWSVKKGPENSGHAMVAVGYDDSMDAFKILNSWGRDWGNDGFFWMKYDLFTQVVREGYVAKDAINGNTVVTPDPVNTVVNNPLAFLTAAFTLDDVQHNLQSPLWGPGMTFVGRIQLPPGVGKTCQIAVRFFYNDGFNGKGIPVGSANFAFSYPDGTAVTASEMFFIPPEGGSFYWQADMPYNVMNVIRGYNDLYGQYVPYQSDLVAEPVLFIDNFAVQIGQPVLFWIRL